MSRALHGVWLCALLSVACGDRFESGAGDGGVAAAGGGGATADSGGASASGGVAGLGGVVGIGGIVGLGGVTAGPFPSTPVLDDFDREDGDLGPRWTGTSSDFGVVGQRLADRTGAGNAVFWADSFGPAQEVFATLSEFQSSAREINLLLKGQGDAGCEYIEVMYQPDRETVQVEHCAGGTWTVVGGAPVVLTPGDTLGARLSATGQLELFQNGTRFLILDAADYAHQSGGYIGVNSLDHGAVWDDFGGGDVR